MNNFHSIHIRPATPADVPGITRIYNEYVLHSTASFETEPVTEQEMLRRMQAIVPALPYLVCEAGGELAGYCYAHPWKERAAYAHTLETTIYLSPTHTGQGLGRMLMERLMTECRALPGCHALIACITAENRASRTLHRRLGFQQVSHFQAVGRKFGRCLDVEDYEYLFPETGPEGTLLSPWAR